MRFTYQNLKSCNPQIRNKKHKNQNARFIDEKLKAQSLMFFVLSFFMWFARFQILICEPQSIWRKLLVLSWLYTVTNKVHESFCCIKIMTLSFLVHDFILFFGITMYYIYWDSLRDKRNGISFWVSPRKWHFFWKWQWFFFVKRFQSFRGNNATVFVSRA